MNAETIALAPFQSFQMAFGRHLRDPRGSPRPAGVPERTAGLYRELVYNNLEGFLLACFPVSHALLGRRWPRLVRGFLRDCRCRTPYFREIPAEFLAWLMAGEPPGPLPSWLVELAHYEWAELAVDVMDVEVPTTPPPADPAAARLRLNPTLLNLAYRWPVHRIGPGYRPRKPRETRLLVYRDGLDDVRFMEVTPATAALLAHLTAPGQSGEAACRRFVATLAPDATRSAPSVESALAQLTELIDAEVVFGEMP